MRRRRSAAAVFAAVALATGLVAGCSEQKPPAPTKAQEEIQLPADYSGTGPGTLVSATKFDTVDRRMLRVSSIAARFTYDSTSGIDGSPQVVSGSVFSPNGTPPEGGWPVIVFGHGTTGVEHDCAPSLSPNLFGFADVVRALLGLGYVMVIPDYQGLGLDNTYHPYLDAATVGHNMIDAARAIRKLVPDTSDKWVAFGVSQGGQASWAANELINTYGAGDTRLVGSVSVSPAADVTGLADVAAEGRLTPQQAVALSLFLRALKNQNPNINLDDYRRGSVQENWDLLTGCSDVEPDKRLEVANQVSPDDLRPVSQQATDELRGYLNRMSGLPRFPAAAPMLIVHGDADETIPVQWTEEAVKRACDMGDTLASFIAAGRHHGDFDPIVALDWVMKRFADTPVDNTCTVEGGPSILKTT